MEAIVQDIHPIRSRVCKRKVQISKSKKKLLERTRNVADVKEKKKETVRRSSRCKATLSTSTTIDAFVKRTKKKSSERIRNIRYQTSKKPTQAQQGLNKSTKRKRKKHNVGCASFFSPPEPEIKLKCLNYKEEKKDVRDETFVPYVRIKDFPICTVVNYPEDSVRIKQGKPQACGGFASGVMPATPGLQFGRVCVDVSRRDVLVCCLCGGSANAMTSETCMGHITLKVSNRPLKRFVIHRKRIIVTRTRLLEGNVLLQADGLSLFGPAIASCPLVLPLRDLG